MEPTFLHMIYAGRGDAFVIEYTDPTGIRRLVILDGGPLFDSYLRPSTSPKAPYYKYLFSAIKQIWGRIPVANPPPVAPTAIFISHAHNDHYGGILHMVQSSLSNDFHPTSLPSDKMFFNGPFIVPFVDKGTGYREVHSCLVAKGFSEAFGSTAIETFSIAYPSVAPAAEEMLLYVRAAPPPKPPPLGRDYSVDKSKENIRSILMTHQVNDATTGNPISRMLFTGDSAGYVIKACMTDTTPPPIYSIYKIQHHGSLRNSQSADTPGKVSSVIAGEAQLLAVLRWGLQKDRSGIPPLINLSGDSLNRLWFYLIKLLKSLGVSAPSLLAELTDRQIGYIKDCLDPSTLELTQPDDTISKYWRDFERTIKKISPSPFYSTRRTLRSKKWYKVPNPWWLSFQKDDIWKDKYLAIMATVQIRAFFKTFHARAYVVSANRSYGHVSAETLVGLAQALCDKASAAPGYATAPLFVTSPHAVDFSAAQKLCTTLGRKMTDLFPSDATKPGLLIRYLPGRAYMTLNATLGDLSPDQREISKRSEAMSAEPPYLTTDEIHDQLESDKSVLPDPTLNLDLYYIGADVSGTPWFLDLSSDDPSMTTTKPAQGCTIVEPWESGDGLQSDEISVSSVSSSSPTSTIRIQKAGTNSWYLFPENLDDPMEEWEIYLDASTNKPAVRSGLAPIPVNPNTMAFGFHIAPAGSNIPFQYIPRLMNVPPAAQTLRKYCTDADIDISAGLKGATAITAIAGDPNSRQLTFDLDFEVELLGYAADLDKSLVTYTMDQLNVTTTSATLILPLPPDANITIDGQQILIQSVKILISWDADLSITLSIAGPPSQGFSMSVSKSVPKAMRTCTLDHLLRVSSFEAASVQKITIGKILAYAVDDEDRVVDMMSRIPRELLLDGLMSWKPVHDESFAAASLTPTDRIQISVLQLQCDVSNLKLIDILGINFVVKDMGFTLIDAQLESQTLTLQGSVLVSATSNGERWQEDLEKGVTASLCVVLSDRNTQFTFSLSGGSSMTDLESLLPGGSQLGNVNVPFKDSPLSSLTSSGVGFVLSQPVTGTGSYELASVFGAVSFDESIWRQFLPPSFPVPLSTSIRVEILYPMKEQTRAVRVAIDLKCAIATNKALQAVFAAEPSAVPGEYEYRVSLTTAADSEAASFTELIQALGMADAVSALSSVLPLIGSVLDKVTLNELSTAVSYDDAHQKWNFTEFVIELGLSSWTIMSNVLELEDAQLYIESCNDAWLCRVNAGILVGEYELTVALQIPTADLPGYLKIDNPQGLSVAGLLAAFNFPSLSGVPVVGNLLNTALISANITFGYGVHGSGVDTSPSILGFEVTLSNESVDLGLFTFNSIGLSLEYHYAADPYGPSKDQTVFSLQGMINFGRSPLAAMVAYDSLTGIASGSLRPLQPISVNQAVNSLLGATVVNSLLPVIGDLDIDHISMSFLAPEFQVRTFSIALSSNATVTLDQVVLKSLKLEYKAAGIDPDKPMSYVLLGSTRGPNVDADFQISCVKEASASPDLTVVGASISEARGGHLTLSGILGLFLVKYSVNNAPDGSPKDLIDLRIILASAEISFGSKASSLQLESMKLRVESNDFTVSILENPQFSFDGIRLDVDYKRGEETTGQVQARFTILHTIQLWLFYSKDISGETFVGTVRVDDNDGLDYPALAGFLGLQPADYDMPKDLGIPATIPCTSIGGILRVGHSIELYGNAKPTEMQFNEGNVQIALRELGGRAIVLQNTSKATAPAPPTYQAYLYGQIQFTGFKSAASAYARLRIGSKQDPILTAMVQATDASSLEALTAQMADDRKPLSTYLPSGTTAIDFTVSLWFYLNAHTTEFVLMGVANNLGGGLLLGQPVDTATKQRSYLFSLALADVGALWPSLTDRLKPYVTFKTAGAEILAFTSSRQKLRAQLEDIDTVAREDGVFVANSWPDIPLLSDPSTDEITPGATLYAQLDLTGTGSLSQMFGLCAHDEGTTAITLWAHLDQDLKSTDLKIIVENFVLFGNALKLTKGVGSYTFSTQAVQITATLSLSLTADQSFDFEIDFDLDKDTMHFQLQAGGKTVNIPNPFDGMYSITLEDVSIDGTITWDRSGAPPKKPKRSYKLIVQKQVAGLNMSASILFYDDGKGILAPAVATLEISTPVSVLDIFRYIITAAAPGVAWPSGFDPISFNSGEIYYCNCEPGQSITVDNKDYQHGYHIQAEIVLLDEFTFLVTADLPPQKSGIIVTGEHEGWIDFGFAQLVNKEQPDAKNRGPIVTIDTTRPKNTIYQLDMDLRLLGKLIADFTLSYETGPKAFHGKIGYPGDLLGIPSPTLEFVYQNGRFQIVSLPALQDLGDKILSLEKLLESASESQEWGSCPKIAGLVMDGKAGFSTEFNMSIGEFGFDKASKSITGQLTSTFSFTLNVDGHEPLKIADIDIGDPIQLTIFAADPSGDFTVDDIVSGLVKALVGDAARIGEKILLNPKYMAEIVGLFAAAQIANWGVGALAGLVCKFRDIPDLDKGGGQAAATATTAAGQAGSPGPQCIDHSNASKTALTIMDAVAAYLKARDDLTKCRDDTKSLISLLNTLVSKGQAGAEENLAAVMKLISDARDALQSAKNAISDAIVFSAAPKVSFSTDNTKLIVDVSALPNGKEVGWYDKWNNFTWRVRYNSTNDLGQAKKKLWDPQHGTSNVITIEDKDILYDADVYTWVDAIYTDGQQQFYSTTALPGPAATHIPPLRPVDSVTFALSDPETCTVTTSTAPQGQYRVQIVGAEDQTVILGSITLLTPATGTVNHSFSIQQDLSTSVSVPNVLARVQALSQDPKVSNSVWTNSKTQFPLAMAPAGFKVAVDNDILNVRWQQEGQQYKFNIAKADGSPWDPNTKRTDSFDPPNVVHIQLSGGSIVNGAVVNMGARPIPAVGTVGLFATANKYTVITVPAPTISKDSYLDQDTNTLHLSWSWIGPIPSTSTFECMLSPGGIIKPLTATWTPGSLSASATLAVDTANLPESVQICIVDGGSGGPWSWPWNITPFRPLQPPSSPHGTIILTSSSTPALSVTFDPASPSGVPTVVATLAANGYVVATLQAPSNTGAVVFASPEVALKPQLTYSLRLAYWTPTIHGLSTEIQVTTPSRLDFARQLKSQGHSALDTWKALDAYSPLAGDEAAMYETTGNLLAAGFGNSDIASAGSTLGKLVDPSQMLSRLQTLEDAFRTMATFGVPMQLAVPLTGALFADLPPVLIAASVATAAPKGTWTQYGSLVSNQPKDDPQQVDDAMFGGPWQLPAVCVRENIAAFGARMAFRALMMTHPNIVAVEGFAVIMASDQSVQLGDAQRVWGIEDRNAYVQMMMLLQYDDTDPGRKFVLEMRKTDGELSDQGIMGFLHMLYPEMTEQQIRNAMRP